jgi:hypothetical protein
MAEIYFHYSNAEGVLIERRGALVANLAEARDYAELVVRSLVTTPGPEDWRRWVLHVRDDLGEEILVVPFASLLGKPHWGVGVSC